MVKNRPNIKSFVVSATRGRRKIRRGIITRASKADIKKRLLRLAPKSKLTNLKLSSRKRIIALGRKIQPKKPKRLFRGRISGFKVVSFDI